MFLFAFVTTVKIDKDGNIIGKVGAEEEEEDQQDNEKGNTEHFEELPVGTRVSASYHANEQFDGHEAWYDGVISKVNESETGVITYDIDYDDGDFEENVEQRHVKLIGEVIKEPKKEPVKKVVDPSLKEKRKKAREKAR